MLRPPPRSPLFPYTTLFRSVEELEVGLHRGLQQRPRVDRGHAGADPRRLGTDRRALGAHLGGRARPEVVAVDGRVGELEEDRKSTRLNSSHMSISYAVFCLK